MSTPATSPKQRSPLLFIFLTVFIDLLGFGIVIPLLPIYSKAYGASGFTCSLLFACFSGMQFLFAPMWGRLSDRIGRRPVLIGGLLGTSVSYVLFGFADEIAAWLLRLWGEGAPALDVTTLAVLFSTRMLAGFFGANVSTAAAFMADVTTEANRAKGMGLIGAAFGLGFMFGPWFGGELSTHSIHYPGVVAALLSLSAAVFGYFTLVEPEREKRTHSRVYGWAQARAAFADARIGWAMWLSFAAILAFSAFETMFVWFGLANFPEKFGITSVIERATRDEVFDAARFSGRYLFFIGLISAVIQGGFIRRLVGRYGETRLAIVGPLLLGIGLVVVGSATSFWVVILGCVVMPFGFGVNNPSVNALISRASPADQQGAYLGVQQSLLSLARMIGPALAGLLYDYRGSRSPFFAAAALLLGATLFAYAYHRRFAASFAAKAEH